MKTVTFILCLTTLLVSDLAQKHSTASAPQIETTHPRNQRIVIAADRMLDGRGHVLRNTRIVIEGSKILAIDPKASPIDYDLRGLTVLPGWIDAALPLPLRRACGSPVKLFN